MHMGWPYFVKNSWVATPDKGLAVIAYAPVEVNAFVADGIAVKLAVETNYPFEEKIRIKVRPQKAATFPLKLRIPKWCTIPEVSVNGAKMTGVKSGSILTVNRLWKKGDEIVLNFPMMVSFSQQVNRSVTVERGPIVYGLKIDAAYTIRKEHPVKGFFDYEVKPASAWNYALTFDNITQAEPVKVGKKAMPENPFEQSVTPVTLRLKARKLPTWKVSDNEMHAEEIPNGPVSSDQPLEEIILTPYGSENIRISNFPVILPPAGYPPMVAFNENFDSATLNSWINYGQWFIKDGAIHSASNKGSWGYGIHGVKSVASNTHIGDLSYEATVKVASKGNAGVIFRVSSPNLGVDSYNGYYVGIDAENGRIQLGKSSGRKWTLLKEYSQQLEMNKAYAIKIMAKGDQIMVYFDHGATPVISVTDSEFSAGAIGVRAYDCMASIDDIKIKVL
jgi:hypothetical protein